MLGNWSLPTTQEYPPGELQLGGGQGSRTWRTFSDTEWTQNHFLRKRRLRKRESKREKQRERNRVRKRAREGEQESESERDERERDSLSRSLSFFFSVSFPLSLLSLSLTLSHFLPKFSTFSDPGSQDRASSATLVVAVAATTHHSYSHPGGGLRSRWPQSPAIGFTPEQWVIIAAPTAQM